MKIVIRTTARIPQKPPTIGAIKFGGGRQRSPRQGSTKQIFFLHFQKEDRYSYQL
jgi:hypothetical protein